jgi:hypothetical protein
MRQALQTLADTTCNARLRGDNKAVLCFIQALQVLTFLALLVQKYRRLLTYANVCWRMLG